MSRTGLVLDWRTEEHQAASWPVASEAIRTDADDALKGPHATFRRTQCDPSELDVRWELVKVGGLLARLAEAPQRLFCHQGGSFGRWNPVAADRALPTATGGLLGAVAPESGRHWHCRAKCATQAAPPDTRGRPQNGGVRRSAAVGDQQVWGVGRPFTPLVRFAVRRVGQLVPDGCSVSVGHSCPPGRHVRVHARVRAS